MDKNEMELNKKQYMIEHFKNNDLFNVKELIIGKEKKFKSYLNDMQNGLINFCISINSLQSEHNFFNLQLNNQFKFNECIDKSVLKMQKDFADIENIYNKCKNRCFDKFPQSRENLEKYIDGKHNYSRPRLNPCLSECGDFFNSLHNRYFQYLIKGINCSNNYR